MVILQFHKLPTRLGFRNYLRQEPTQYNDSLVVRFAAKRFQMTFPQKSPTDAGLMQQQQPTQLPHQRGGGCCQHTGRCNRASHINFQSEMSCKMQSIYVATRFRPARLTWQASVAASSICQLSLTATYRTDCLSPAIGCSCWPCVIIQYRNWQRLLVDRRCTGNVDFSPRVVMQSARQCDRFVRLSIDLCPSYSCPDA